ncbi:hypothetical protein EDB83DRAFT_2474593 [Lactarius deliciosus]|nr:hypothetical protein EDB83DRAFT_2474593 [Lactarius deliciosus]
MRPTIPIHPLACKNVLVVTAFTTPDGTAAPTDDDPELAQPRQWTPPFICVSLPSCSCRHTSLPLPVGPSTGPGSACQTRRAPQSYSLGSTNFLASSLSTSSMPDHIRHVASSSLPFSLTLPPPIFPKTNPPSPQDSFLNVSTTICCTAAHLCLEGPRVTGDVRHSLRWDLITTQ